MTELPKSLQNAIPADLTEDAVHWWIKLTDADRAELTRLCDARKEAFLFETYDPARSGQRISGGRFLPHDDSLGIGEWGDEYFDTLLSNAELVLVYDPPLRTFYIGCNQHAHARACFHLGRIDSEFSCPFRKEDCLVDRIRGQRDAIGLRRLVHGQ